MKNLLKIAIISVLLIFSGLNITNADGSDDGNGGGSGTPSSNEVITGDGTLIPICRGGDTECNLQRGGDRAGETLSGVKDGGVAGGGFFDYVQDFIKYLLTFLTIIGVIYIIYAGLLLLTSAGEEEKMTKARKNIFYVMIGITVIYLAYPIVSFIVKAIS